MTTAKSEVFWGVENCYSVGGLTVDWGGGDKNFVGDSLLGWIY